MQLAYNLGMLKVATGTTAIMPTQGPIKSNPAALARGMVNMHSPEDTVPAHKEKQKRILAQGQAAMFKPTEEEQHETQVANNPTQADATAVLGRKPAYQPQPQQPASTAEEWSATATPQGSGAATGQSGVTGPSTPNTTAKPSWRKRIGQTAIGKFGRRAAKIAPWAALGGAGAIAGGLLGAGSGNGGHSNFGQHGLGGIARGAAVGLGVGLAGYGAYKGYQAMKNSGGIGAGWDKVKNWWNSKPAVEAPAAENKASNVVGGEAEFKKPAVETPVNPQTTEEKKAVGI